LALRRYIHWLRTVTTMAWRLARSLDVLRDEVRTLHPGTRVDTIGNEEHQDDASDHNPNPAGVVCAADFFPDRGLNLARFAEQVRNPNHPAVKYVIFNRRIWSKSRNAEGWRDYDGDNPHTGHVHVSVGIGPDGRSTGPYDNPAPWGLEDNMPLSNEDVTKVANATARATARELAEHRYGRADAEGTITLPSSADWARHHAGGVKTAIRAQVLPQLAAILAALSGQDAATAVRAAIRDEFAALGATLVTELRGELGDTVPGDAVEAAVQRTLGSLQDG
jgi:hypothetical protein